MSGLFTWVFVQVVFRSVAWVFATAFAWIGSLIPDGVAAGAGAAWAAVYAVMWNPWVWTVVLPGAALIDFVVARVAARRRRARSGFAD
jgi:hypothetical protein